MQILTPLLLEATTNVYAFAIADEQAQTIPPAELDALTLTYFDQTTHAIINGRDNQNVLNTNDVVVETVTDASTTPPTITTVVHWTLQPDDTVCLHPTQTWEVHVAQFELQWADTVRVARHRIGIGVEHVLHLPGV
jgi:hypothetical protein